MPHIVLPDRCIMCGACMVYCKEKALTVKNKKAFIIREKCIDCRNCIGRCLGRAIVSEDELSKEELEQIHKQTK